MPFLPFVSEGNLFNYGLFILIYALLALGLNVVVGFAGLLDLGYVAFFGFGAYTYAFLSGTHSNKGHVYTHHWDAQYSILAAVLICALLGLFLGSSSRRLLGDYLAIVTLFFGQAFVVFTNAADPTGSPTARTAWRTSTRSTSSASRSTRRAATTGSCSAASSSC